MLMGFLEKWDQVNNKKKIIIYYEFVFLFQGIDQLVESTEENQPGTFNGDFHMEFCDNKKQLFQAYFRDFTIERLESPWQAFTGGWYVHIKNLRFD